MISRRNFIKTSSVLGGAFVLAPSPGCLVVDSDRLVYDELSGSIRGQVAVDRDILFEYSSDYAGFILKTPKYVVFPKDVEDMVKVLQIANQHKVMVTVRGQGHSLGGQSLSEGGILLTTAGVGMDLENIDNGYKVSGGTTWLAVEEALNREGKAFPVQTNYLGLSVGGTLAHAGIGRASVKYGHQIENVDSIRLLTPNGVIHRCSKNENADLFSYGLASLGQLGVILDVEFSEVKTLRKTRFIYNAFESLEEYIKLSDLILSDYFDDIDYYVGYYFSGRFMIGVGKDFQREAELEKGSFKRLSVHFNDDYTESTDNFNIMMHNSLVQQIEGEVKSDLSFKDKSHVWDHYLFTKDACFEFLRKCFASEREIGFKNTSPLMNSYIINNRNKSVHPFSPSYNFDNEPFLMNIGFLANVEDSDNESLKFYRERSDQYMEWCINLKGRPYLYGHNSPDQVMKEKLYSENLDKMEKLKQLHDPNSILNNGLIV
ncbi:MAG: hypothetical protein COB85_01460 [Bacteroidetes bacterium]|nr:MAG: hypothetical protein COB85_01460 [Bacteroidota bacterium]